MITAAFRQLLALLGMALVPALVAGALQLKWNKEAPLLPDEIRLTTAMAWGEKTLWVDARDAEQFSHEHIPGAVSLTTDGWEELVPPFLDAWDPEKSIIVYGQGSAADDDAHAVSVRLREELKLDGVFVLKGGWAAWLQK